MNPVAKTLVAAGILFIALGLLWHLTHGQIPLGRLPGDIHIKSKNTQIFIPIMTSIILSIVLSLFFYFTRR